jgi:hypothetical protein
MVSGKIFIQILPSDSKKACGNLALRPLLVTTQVSLKKYSTLPPQHSAVVILHYCLTDLSVDSNDITALVSGEQKHYFHLWGLQKPLVAFATRDFFRPHS